MWFSFSRVGVYTEISATGEVLPGPTAPLAPASQAVTPAHAFPPQPAPGRGCEGGQSCGAE